MGPPRRVCRAGLLFVLLVALAAGDAGPHGEPPGEEGGRDGIGDARCGTQNAGQCRPGGPGALLCRHGLDGRVYYRTRLSDLPEATGCRAGLNPPCVG
uniref:Uncharacterized protein n=1 Tax=Human herpesvirus 1 TaxID=10298 RepID=Q68975_HHV1|nr:unknown protein [Human alphaherpesvirus 1]